jgi:ParB family chromosome partitioning protein
MLEELKLTQEEVSEKVAKKRSTVANYLRLLKLPPEIQLGIRSRKITMGHARALVNIEDPKLQLSLYNQILSSEMSVRRVEEAARNTKSGTPDKPVETSVSQAIKSAEKMLHQRLSAPVDIKSGKDGKGQISIKFNSESELNEILRKLIP